MKGMVIRGFVIWLVATVALRLGGQYVLHASTASIILLLLFSLPVMVGVALAMLRPYAVAHERGLAAIALVAPGMILDTVSASWFPALFPNIPANAAGVFGGWLLFCNVVVLLTAAVMGPGTERKVA